MIFDIIIFSLIIESISSQLLNNAELSITTAILKDYNKLMRPSDTVNIIVDVQLKQIIDIGEKDQMVTTSSYLYISWNDSRFYWNSSWYNNVQNVLIPAKQIWLPDLFTVNTADPNGFLPISETNLAIVNNSGEIYLNIGLNGIFSNQNFDL